MSLTNILTKEDARSVRSSRRRATYDGRHEWRRDENSAKRKTTLNNRDNSPILGVHGNLALQLDEMTDIPDQQTRSPSPNEDDMLERYRALKQIAPSLFKSHPLSDVVYLLDEYGVDAVIEGYHWSRRTGSPFAHEVMMASIRPKDQTINPAVLEILAEDQTRGMPNPWTMYNPGLYGRFKTAKNGHVFEHSTNDPLDPR